MQEHFLRVGHLTQQPKDGVGAASGGNRVAEKQQSKKSGLQAWTQEAREPEARACSRGIDQILFGQRDGDCTAEELALGEFHACVRAME